MLARLRKSQEDNESGFTLIELLVVIIIIGILAAIAIPTFLKQREKGWNAAAKSELKNAATAQESYFTEVQPNSYPTTESNLVNEGFNRNADITFSILEGTTSEYCMSAKHKSGGKTYYYSHTSGAPVETKPATCP